MGSVDPVNLTVLINFSFGQNRWSSKRRFKGIFSGLGISRQDELHTGDGYAKRIY